MLQGTGSHVGKSVLTAAVCRILRDMGYSVAPFKSQNMALNSFVTAGGGEIGVAQAHQAAAAGIKPTVDMNPVLLKPTGDKTSQVIIHGRVHGVMSAVEYHRFKKKAREFVLESYRRLSAAYDIIVIEGAGSPAEINLRENDIANMGMAELADSPVVIVGDIDRGGVFASLVGTMELLTLEERARVKGFIINKFRGDASLLTPAVDFLAGRTGVAVLGVVPYIDSLFLPAEDGVELDGRAHRASGGSSLKVVVIRLPRISNFTDIDPLKCEPGVEVRFTTDPGDIPGADLVIIPGSKNTLEDLRWLHDTGLGAAVSEFSAAGGMVAGLCGGFQMLGSSVADPCGVESRVSSAEGLGLLDIETVLGVEKKTFQVQASAALPGTDGVASVEGYEIHMGESTGRVRPFARITARNGAKTEVADGAVSADGSVWGTYIHGIFDNDSFRRAFVSALRVRKGAGPDTGSYEGAAGFRELREASINRVAELVRSSLDMDELLRIIGAPGLKVPHGVGVKPA